MRSVSKFHRHHKQQSFFAALGHLIRVEFRIVVVWLFVCIDYCILFAALPMTCVCPMHMCMCLCACMYVFMYVCLKSVFLFVWEDKWMPLCRLCGANAVDWSQHDVDYLPLRYLFAAYFYSSQYIDNLKYSILKISCLFTCSVAPHYHTAYLETDRINQILIEHFYARVITVNTPHTRT